MASELWGWLYFHVCSRRRIIRLLTLSGSSFSKRFSDWFTVDFTTITEVHQLTRTVSRDSWYGRIVGLDIGKDVAIDFAPDMVESTCSLG